MNTYVLIAGIISLMATVGHFAMGKKMYLKPVLDSNLDQVPKKVMHSLFHYMSVFMVLSTFVLLARCGNKCMMYENVYDVVKFVGIVYGFFAITQFIIAATSGIKNGIFNMFQWIFWLLISVFALLGVM